MFKRARHQFGWLEKRKRKRGPEVWVFRHTYSTLLHAYGTDMKVQQELLRHSDIRTTMNIYTHTVSPALREANSKVVRMVLPERKTA
jgi:integrase